MYFHYIVSYADLAIASPSVPKSMVQEIYIQESKWVYNRTVSDLVLCKKYIVSYHLNIYICFDLAI